VNDGGVFTVLGTATITGAASFYPLFIQNTDPSYLMVIDRVFVQVVGATGGTAPPNAGDYFSALLNTTGSGGTAVTPTNLNRTSTKVANCTALNLNPTVVITSALESHRWFSQSNGVAYELVPSRLDDMILGRNNTLAIRYTTTNTSGTVLATVTFMMTTTDSLP
jgi:hypothetical protein